MRTLSATPSRPPRLILRVLQTDTDRRFALLIFAILSTSLTISYIELVALFLRQPFLDCSADSLSSPSTLTIAGLNFSCAWQPDLWLLLWSLVGLLLVLGVAFLIYWLFPAWKCWRENLQPLKETEFPEVIEYLEELRKTHLPSIRLSYVYNLLGGDRNPLVFGSLGRYFLYVPGTWIKLLSGNQETTGEISREILQSVTLHELSHLHNKDVNRYYFAKSILYSFTIVSLLPFLLLLVSSLLLPFFNLIGDRVAITIFVASNFSLGIIFPIIQVPAIYYAILRSREVYADLQAVQWDSSPDILKRTLDILAPETKFSWRHIIPIFNAHPSLEERKGNIDNPPRVFRLKLWEAFGIGIVFGIAFPAIQGTFGIIGQILTDWIFKVNYPAGFPDLGTLLFCLFAVPIIGQMIWRAKIVTRIQDQELRGTGRFGLCLAAGLVLGFFVAPSFTPFVIGYQASWQIILFYFVPWVMLLALGLYGLCKWLVLLASHWLEVVNTERGLRLVSRVSFGIAGLILAVGFGLFSLLLQTTLGYLLLDNLNIYILTHPISLQPVADIDFYWRFIFQAFFVEQLPMFYIFFILASLWVLPFLSWFWYRRRMSRSRFQWAIADPIEYPKPTIPKNPFRLHSVGLIALMGSLIFCLLLLYIGLKANVSVFVVGPFLLSATISLFMLAALFQAGIAVVIIIRTRPLGMINGLLGAFLSGLVTVVGTIGFYRLFGGIGPDGPRFIFLYEMNWGIVYTLGLVLFIGMLQSKSHAQLKRRLLIFTPCVLLIGAITLLPVITTLALSDPQAATNIVKDGDFESPIILLYDAEKYSAKQTFGPWTVAAGSIDLISTYWVPAHGAQSVALNDTTAGSIYQDLSTISGASYSLSFAMAGNPACAAQKEMQMQVWLGSTLVTSLSFNITGYSWNYMGWQYHTYKVHATAAVMRLSFISLTPSACGPALDNVTVERCTSDECTNLTSATPTSLTPTSTSTTSATSTSLTPTSTSTTSPTPTSASTAQPTPTPVTTPNPYAPYMGTLIMDDPLLDNSRGYAWDETVTRSISCGFSGGAYHVQAMTLGGVICYPEASSLLQLSNLTYEISLKAVQGDVGGIAFRFNQNNVTGYIFFINTQLGTYVLGAANGTVTPSRAILSGSSTAIREGLNQSNVLAVVANGSTINLYINGQFITTANDSAYSQGQIGIFTADSAGPADVQASNARAWTV